MNTLGWTLMVIFAAGLLLAVAPGVPGLGRAFGVLAMLIVLAVVAGVLILAHFTALTN